MWRRAVGARKAGACAYCSCVNDNNPQPRHGRGAVPWQCYGHLHRASAGLRSSPASFTCTANSTKQAVTVRRGRGRARATEDPDMPGHHPV